jgi:hypothetical protein
MGTSPWIAKNNTVPHDAHANLVRTAFESYRYRHLASVQRDLLGLSTLERVRRSARSIFQELAECSLWLCQQVNAVSTTDTDTG